MTSNRLVKSDSDRLRRNVILVVDDDVTMGAIYQGTAENYFDKQYFPTPGTEVQVEWADNLLDAAKVLYNPNNRMVGVILDNKFPLRENGDEVGEYHRDKHPNDTDEIEKLRVQEGAAGTMLFRQMRTGKTGVAAALSRQEIEETEVMLDGRKIKGLQGILRNLGDELDARQHELREIPVLWHSGETPRKKVNTVRLIQNELYIQPSMDETTEEYARRLATYELPREEASTLRKQFAVIKETVRQNKPPTSEPLPKKNISHHIGSKGKWGDIPEGHIGFVDRTLICSGKKMTECEYFLEYLRMAYQAQHTPEISVDDLSRVDRQAIPHPDHRELNGGGTTVKAINPDTPHLTAHN